MRGNRAVVTKAALGAGLTVVVGMAVWVAWPRWRSLVFDENGIVEDLQLAFYVLAFIIGLVAAIRLRGRYKTLSLALIPATALLFAVEEWIGGLCSLVGMSLAGPPGPA